MLPTHLALGYTSREWPFGVSICLPTHDHLDLVTLWGL